MKSIAALIENAQALTQQGLSEGEVADELNVARETARWLVAQSGRQPSGEESLDSPMDVHVDWSAIGRDGHRLGLLGALMGDLLAGEGTDVDLTVGIGHSGGPLATVVSQELDTDLGVYMPGKYQSSDDTGDEATGIVSQNFATIEDSDCFVVDDNIDTGQTMTETIERIRDEGGTPKACVVLTDKLGQDEIGGVPVYSLIQMVQMGDK